MHLSVALHKVAERSKLKFFLFISACVQVWAREWYRRAHSAGRHLLLQGVCVRPRQQQAAKHIHHLCPNHTLSHTHPSSHTLNSSNQPLSGGLLRRHAQNQFPKIVTCSLKHGEKKVFKIFRVYFPLSLLLQDNEFFCWQSADKVCIQAALQCDYHADCPHGEDEDGCGELHLAFPGHTQNRLLSQAVGTILNLETVSG